MGQKFSYTGDVTISHINARKEGPDDDKVLAVDLKLALVTSSSIFALFDEKLQVFLFTDIGAVRNTMIGAIPFGFELEDYRLEAVGGTFFGVRVKKFTVAPKDNFQAEVSFQVSFKPSGDEVARMAEFLQEDMEISLQPTNEELDLSPQQAARKLHDSLAKDCITATLSGANGESITFGSGDDPMYPEAVGIVIAHQRASISLVQRHLRIGYNRAARLIEAIEQKGLVSSMDGKGERTIRKAA